MIQRFCSPQAHSFTIGELFEDDVNVIKHFDVIAEKPNWLHEDAPISAALELKNGGFDSCAEPRASGHSLALKSEPPVGRFERSFGRGLNNIDVRFRLPRASGQQRTRGKQE